MIRQKTANRQLFLLGQAALIFVWLTDLSALAGTDTYYSVYLLCAVASLLCLVDNHHRQAGCSRGQGWAIGLTSAAFSLAVVLANYALFEPLSVLENLFNLLCCLAGGLCVAQPIVLWGLNRLPLAAAGEGRKHPARLFWAVFASIAAIDLLYLFFARYPGVLTTDSITTVEQLLGQQSYDNTMPFWHTMTVKVFVELGMGLFGNINAGVALFHGAQILFMAACFGCCVVTLYQAGLPRWVLVVVYGLYAFQPHHIAYSVTLWKDIPFAGAALLFLAGFYRILRGVGKSVRLNYALLILGGLGLCLWRTNGWYAFAVTTLVLWLLLRRKQKRLLRVMLVLVVVCWLLLNPVLNLLGVKPTNFVEAFAVPMQQVARVVAEGRELSAQQQELLGQIFLMDKLPSSYDPLTVDPVKFECFRYDQVGHILDNLPAYAKLYLELGLRYPGDFLKAWIDETKGYWNGGYFFWIYTKGVGENTLGITASYGENPIASGFAALFRYVEKLPILQGLVSIGLHIWTLIGCGILCLMKKRPEGLLTIPLLVLVAGLWLGSPVYAEFRYAYPVMVSMPLILSVTAYSKN